MIYTGQFCLLTSDLANKLKISNLVSSNKMVIEKLATMMPRSRRPQTKHAHISFIHTYNCTYYLLLKAAFDDLS